MKTIAAILVSLVMCMSNAFAGDDTTLKAKVETATEAKSDSAAAGGFTDMVCTNGGNTRRVELVTGAGENKLPCEVHYKKETEQPGHDQVLWSANSDLSFCHAKASAFVDKLTGMGWACAAK